MDDLTSSLASTTAAVCSALAWVDHASISLAYEDGEPQTVGSTDPRVLEAGSAQHRLGEGPSVLAARGHELVHSADVSRDPRWPQYSSRAAQLGIGAQVAARLPTGAGAAGCLNLYALTPRGIDDASIAITQMFAAHAATLVGCGMRVQRLTQALDARREISQAIGILMERYGVNESRAFDHLVQESQSSQVKVRVLAQQLVRDAPDGELRDSERMLDRGLLSLTS